MPVPLLWESTRWGHADDHSVIHKPYQEVLLDADPCAEPLGVRDGIMRPVPPGAHRGPQDTGCTGNAGGLRGGRETVDLTWACDVGEGPTENVAQSGDLKEE